MTKISMRTYKTFSPLFLALPFVMCHAQTVSQPAGVPGGFANPCTGPNCYIGSGSSSSGTATALAFPVLVATNYGNGTTNSIASAITVCGTSTPCTIVVPYFYPFTEVVPGQYWNNYGATPGAPYGNPLTGSTVSGNITIIDNRFGGWISQNNNLGSNAGGTSVLPSGIAHLNNYNYSVAYPTTSMLFLGNVDIASAYDAGINYNGNGLNNKTSYGTRWSFTNAWTPGQHLNTQSSVYNYSVGDAIPNGALTVCYGGYATGADEGCESYDQEIFMGGVEYSGTISGSPGTGAISVTVAPTQGTGTQGAGRYIIDVTTGTITAGTISAITPSGSAPTTITGSSTSWPVSTVIGTLGTAVTTYSTSQTVTPTFGTGSIAGITTSTVVCVADGPSFETVLPTAVGGSTFTAIFRNPHPTSAIIAVGGLCGYGLVLTADNVTNSTFTGNTNTITGTLHRVMPVVSSSSSTSLALWVSAGGVYSTALQPGFGSAWNASTANGYVLYPMATIASVSNGTGGVSNTLTLEPNIVAWTSGDTIDVPLYPWNHFSAGHNIIEKYQPSPGNAAGGDTYTFNGLWASGDTLIGISNNSNPNFYTVNGGVYTPPNGIRFAGLTNYGLFFANAPNSSTIYDGCINVACTSNITVLTAIGNGGAGGDTLKYNESTGAWTLTNSFSANSVTFSGPTATLPPYYQYNGALLLPNDNMSPATLPNLASYTVMGSLTPTVATGPNGDVFLTQASGTGSWYADPTHITSIEVVLTGFSTAASAWNGIYIYDTTNSKVYDFYVGNTSSSTPALDLQAYTYAGSGNPVFSSTLFSQVWFGGGTYHLKIAVAAGTATFSISTNGGQTFSTVGTQSVGTIAKMGYVVADSVMNIKSAVVN